MKQLKHEGNPLVEYLSQEGLKPGDSHTFSCELARRLLAGIVL